MGLSPFHETHVKPCLGLDYVSNRSIQHQGPSYESMFLLVYSWNLLDESCATLQSSEPCYRALPKVIRPSKDIRGRWAFRKERSPADTEIVGDPSSYPSRTLLSSESHVGFGGRFRRFAWHGVVRYHGAAAERRMQLLLMHVDVLTLDHFNKNTRWMDRGPLRTPPPLNSRRKYVMLCPHVL